MKYNLEQLSNDELIQLFKDYDYSLRKFDKSNNLSGNTLRRLFIKRNIDYNKIKNDYLLQQKQLEESKILYCENCGKVIDGSYGSGRFCNRHCATIYGNTHRPKRSAESKKKTSISVKNSIKCQIAAERSRKIYHCKQCNKEFSISDIRDINGRLYCSKECKHKYLSEHTGGYREGSGRGKQGWYKGIHCDSSWELAYLVYHLDHNLYIERCKEKRYYVWNNKQHTYYPDFITNDGIIEIKGYSTDQWKSKEEQNPDVIVLYKDDMKLYLDYVINTYGTDFIKLYDGYNPKLDLKNHTYVWVHNEKENHMIKTDLYDEYINKGFIRGRKQFNKIIN